MTSDLSTARVDPQLEPFIPLFPAADLNDPVTARKKLAALSATASVPDVKGMQIEDRTVPGNPDVPVRIYRPHQAHGTIVWLHGGGFVMGGLDMGRRSGSNCSTSPSSTIGRRRGRHGTSPIRRS